MDTFLGIVIVLILVAAIVAQPLWVMFSRRYPRKQESSDRREPPAE